MHMLAPDRKQVLVLTEFDYEEARPVHSGTVVKSLAKGKERDVR
jgi:hypothetical protein